jgi:hypothetical protein
LTHSLEPELNHFVAAPIKRHLSREKITSIEGYYEFPLFFIFEQFRRSKLLLQHPYPCRIFEGFWCLSLLHHAPIRIKVVRVFHPAGEKEQGQRDPNKFWGTFPARSSRTPCPENRTQKIFGTRPCPNEAMTTTMVLPALLWLTAWAIKMLKRIKEVERRTNQPFWVNQRLLWFSVPAPFFLTKQSGLIKGHLIFLDVISGPRQFTG